MRAPLIRLCLLLSLLIASSASAVTMDWTFVGNPGNACDPQLQVCFGAVGYSYNIGTYEVTNAQYAEFLNAKAASDPLALYNTSMGEPYFDRSWGGITRTGSSGSYTYSTIAGRENIPVIFVSFYDALRFANWLNNGQGSGDTETGAYTLQGGTATPSNGETVTRNSDATIFLTSEDEWYKAAYHDALGTCVGDYCDYPARSDTQTTCTAPTATANRANCIHDLGPDLMTDLTIRGSYTDSASPYGTFDQGGNVLEWIEWNEGSVRVRGNRAGSFNLTADFLAASLRLVDDPTYEHPDVGFRLAMIPEPGTGMLVIAGLVGLAGWRRVRA